MKRIKYTGAIFGFKSEETGNELRIFFKKHTGKDVDFNKIQHYKNGFKLLLFSIPLNTIQQVGITAAGCAPEAIKRFSGLKEFVDWYENCYLHKITWEEIEKVSIIKTKDSSPITLNDSFIEKYKELGLELEVKYDPFPKLAKYEKINLFPERGKAAATIILMNNLLCRVPLDNLRKCELILNMNIFINTKKYSWEHLLSYLGIKTTGDDYIRRYTPDDKDIAYDNKYDSDVIFLCNYFNCVLNEKYPFQYPDNWFEVIKILINFHGGPVGCDGKYIAGYMFAAPRKYLHYFANGKTNKDIALDIFYDNL